MIVDPDFFDHWRTRMVVDALQDEMAPVYIMRLWAHCQTRKSDRHTMPPAGLKAQCRAPHDAAKFEQALAEAGFVQRVGQEICVSGWAEQNASLIAAWENGGKGGRPKKPMGNPTETHGKPSGNPAATHGEPSANPGETDKRREEKKSPSLRSGDSSVALSVSDLVAEGVSEQHAQDWFKARKDKGAKTLTQTAWSAVKAEAAKAGMTPADAVKTAAENAWQGFKADWLHQATRASPSKPPTAAQMAMAQACPTLVAPHLQGYAKQHEPTYAEVINADARLLD